MYLLYRIATALSMLVLAPYYAIRSRRRGVDQQAWGQRFGSLPPEIAVREKENKRGTIWIHAVSVGEVLAAVPLVEALKRRVPEHLIYVSTTTEAGQQLARERLSSADAVFYFPLDWVIAVRRALKCVRPDIVIIMETEIWPNFLREAADLDVPVVFANARISDRSFARYSRWKVLIGEFYGRVLQDADLFLAQTPKDAERLREMGAPEERLEVTGNLKYDVPPPTVGSFGTWLREQIRQQERWPVLVAGSVVAQEEEAVLAAYDIVQRRWRRALLILAPRKTDRFDAAADIVEASGWHLVRRSAIETSGGGSFALDENADVVLVDSIGELAGLYSVGDAVFVGGSLVPAGGHNILEPAWFSRPPVFGRSMENFRDMADQFLSARAAVQVDTGSQLGKVWVQMIEDSALRDRMGNSARQISERNRGANERCVERIIVVLEAKERPA
jgi:3-deoxy-D-manno-octulosonic-acid transferase